MNELFEMVKATTDASMASFKAGHDNGYRLGYKEGYEAGWKAAMTKAQELIEAIPTVKS